MENDSITGAEGAQDVDSILNDYESKTQPQPASAPEGWDKVVSFVDQELAEKEARLAKEEQADIESAYKSIKGETDIDDDLAHGFLLAEAAKNADVAKAFEARKSNPEGWAKALEGISAKLQDKISNVDRKATDDTNSMVAALTGSNKTNSKPDEAPDFTKMDDAEFNKAMKQYNL